MQYNQTSTYNLMMLAGTIWPKLEHTNNTTTDKTGKHYQVSKQTYEHWKCKRVCACRAAIRAM